MEVAVESMASAPALAPRPKPSVRFADGAEQKRVRVNRETLQVVLEQCQRALELLKVADLEPAGQDGAKEEEDEGNSSPEAASMAGDDSESDEFRDLLKSTVESQNFLEKLGSIHASMHHSNSDESVSWNLVTATDLWEDNDVEGEGASDQEGYVLVKQEDIVDGIACYMAAYLLSLKETKELTPDQLQQALSKTFSVKKKRGKIQKALDGTRVIYNVASWGATAIGIYQNPALLKAASTAFWTSCSVISKLF